LSKAGRKFVEKFLRSNFDVVTGNWLRFQWRLVGIDVNGGKACEIDLFTDTAAILNSIVSNSYYGMLRGQISMYLRPEHPIIDI